MESSQEVYRREYDLTGNLSYAIVQAFNHMIINSQATTYSGINQDLEQCTNALTKTVKETRHRKDRTLLSVVSLMRIYRRIAQKVNPH